MWEVLKDFFTDREPGCGYFGGAEGAIRFVFFTLGATVGILIYLIW